MFELCHSRFILKSHTFNCKHYFKRNINVITFMFQLKNYTMKVNTLISLCVKTCMWGMTIKPGEGAKQALLTWKLLMLMCIVLGLNCIYLWQIYPTFLDMIQSGSAEKITKAFMIGVVDLAFSGSSNIQLSTCILIWMSFALQIWFELIFGLYDILFLYLFNMEYNSENM